MLTCHGTQVRNLAPLSSCPGLKHLTVGNYDGVEAQLEAISRTARVSRTAGVSRLTDIKQDQVPEDDDDDTDPGWWGRFGEGFGLRGLEV
jgi:hypothetical protein